MDAHYWHERWQNNRISFHEKNTNPTLEKHFDQLGVQANSRIFVPLCGKSLDMVWLLSQGHQVIGAELNALAIQQFFESLSLTPSTTNLGDVTSHHVENLTIFEGDIFKLSAELIGHIDAIYDRAALVALPSPMRTDYTKHLQKITATAPQLLITYEYPEGAIQGPPFSISEDEIQQHYEKSYAIELLETIPTSNKRMTNILANEKAWRLLPLEERIK